MIKTMKVKKMFIFLVSINSYCIHWRGGNWKRI